MIDSGHIPIEVNVVSTGKDASLPVYASTQAAGADLCACLQEPDTLTLNPGERILVPTGLYLAIPQGYEGQVRPRSGLALKHGVTVLNAPGTIDSDYRGEVGVVLINLGTKPFEIHHGDRIAQLVIAPVSRCAFVRSDSLEHTVRGAGGFGSTGV